MRVVTATTGKEAIGISQSKPEVAIALMDIMMPEMDGYRTTRTRKDDKSRQSPIIALTAKAMKGDREKCVAAGASDYLAKPVNTQQSLAALRSGYTARLRVPRRTPITTPSTLLMVDDQPAKLLKL